MKKLIVILVAFLTVTIITGCNLTETMANAEPASWEKRDFEHSVKQSVRRAVQQPGIDNGSTIVVDSHGDTLISATDSTIARTVYVDIQSPAYPKGISGKNMEILTIIYVIGIIGAIILLILICVLVYTLRRQHNRNKSINNAIEHDYQLPEAFFTGSPAAPQVTINQITQTAPVIIDDNGQPVNSETTTSSTTADSDSVRSALRSVNRACGQMTGKDIRNGFILVGIGLMVFIAFAAGHSPEIGFFIGGSLVVLGLAKFIPYLFNKRS